MFQLGLDRQGKVETGSQDELECPGRVTRQKTAVGLTERRSKGGS